MADNMFHSLFSKNPNNKYVQSGYVCESATDTTGTSGDFSSAGSTFDITNSNGTPIASLDLSGVHISPITEFKSETKILQPYTNYLISGIDFGLAYATQMFRICKELDEVSNWEEFADIEFDINYSSQFKTESLHINTRRYHAEKDDSVIDVIQKILDKLKFPVVISIVVGDDMFNYIKFMSTQLGYQFKIRNLRVIPIYADSSNPDSPFVEKEIVLQNVIDAIIKVNPQPMTRELTYGAISKSVVKTNSMNDAAYEVSCEIYMDIIENMPDGLKYMYVSDPENYDCYNCFIKEYDFDPSDIQQIYKEIYNETGVASIKNSSSDSTGSDSDNDYNWSNSNSSSNSGNNLPGTAGSSSTFYDDNDDTHVVHKLLENLDYEVHAVKYPNGAFRGIMFTVEYPQGEDSQAKNILLNHIQDQIEILEPISINHSIFYKKHPVNVVCGLKIESEYKMYESEVRKTNLEIGQGVITTNHDETWAPAINKYAKFLMEDVDNVEKSESEDGAWTSGKQEGYLKDTHTRKKGVLGTYGYLRYVNDNDTWTHVGQYYSLISNADDANNDTKNLIPSFFLFNPNPYPVKVNLLLFS